MRETDSPSVALITVWSGSLPQYLSLFFATAGANPDIDFFFVADQPPPDRLPPNVNWVEQSWNDTLEAVGRSVNLDLPASAPYKSCDFRPSFGLAFADLLEGHDFWGHIDCDLILGRIRDFATDEILSTHDVVTFRGKGYVHGPLTLYRNKDDINKVFQRAEGWEDVFLASAHCSFDETGMWWGWWADDASQYSDVALPDGFDPSMTEAVRSAESEGVLRWYDVDACDEFGTQWHFRLQRIWRLWWVQPLERVQHLRWVEGRLGRVASDKPLAFYHLVFTKADPAFRIPVIDPLEPPVSFEVTRRGIRASSETGDITLDFVWALRKGDHLVRSTARRVSDGVMRFLSASRRAA